MDYDNGRADLGILRGKAMHESLIWYARWAHHLRADVTGISQDEIKRTLQNLAGKAMLFLDTCHAGQALTGGSGERRRGALDINAVVNDFASAEAGVVAFASSTGREVSFERGAMGSSGPLHIRRMKSMSSIGSQRVDIAQITSNMSVGSTSSSTTTAKRPT